MMHQNKQQQNERSIHKDLDPTSEIDFVLLLVPCELHERGRRRGKGGGKGKGEGEGKESTITLKGM